MGLPGCLTHLSTVGELSLAGFLSNLLPKVRHEGRLTMAQVSFRSTLLGAFMASLAAAPAPAAEVFAGKSIEIIIGADVGGGQDFYGRLLSQFLGKHIPGNPTVVPKNMPGGGSNKAAAYIYSAAPKDGTAIGAVQPGTVMGPLTDKSIMALFDSSKFQYLGSADSGARVCITYKTSKIQKLEDAQKQEAVLAASGDGGSTKDYPSVLNAVAGTKFKVISGYSGTSNMLLAMERGEADGICGYNWSSYQAARPAWITDKTAQIILQQGPDADPLLTQMGVPEVWRFIKNEDDRKLMEFQLSQQSFGFAYILPPETPTLNANILRAAFETTFHDPEYLAAAQKAKLGTNSVSADRVEQLVQELYKMPPSVYDRLKKVLDAGK
jgi:tripartite-type tricarboxylate transporter receptor subunit TctC